MATQLLVLGMHRSGTSTVAGLLYHLGAFVGDDQELIGANAENPKGFWERADVIRLNDMMLQTQRCSWHNPAGWDTSLPLPEALQAETRSIVTLMNQHPLWVMKDPRQCLTLPYWLQALETPTCILVHRDPLAVAHSLRKRNRFPLAVGLALWEFYTHRLLQSVAGQRVVQISYEALIADPQQQAAELIAALDASGLTPDAAAVSSFISPSLQRSSPSEQDEQWFSEEQKTLLKLTQAGQLPASLPPLSPDCLNLLRLSDELMQFQDDYLQLQDEAGRAAAMIDAHDARLEELARGISDLQREYDELMDEHKALHQKNAQLEKARQEAESLTAARDAELETIKATKLWRLREKLVG
jgi:hypothetical protein